MTIPPFVHTPTMPRPDFVNLVLPAGFGEPGMRTGLFGPIQRWVSLHVEVELFLVQIMISIQNHGRHLEAEEQLVLFEDAHAGVIVHGLRHLLPQVPGQRNGKRWLTSPDVVPRPSMVTSVYS